MEDELITVQEAAKQTGMSENGIRTAMSRGTLPYVEKYGRKLIRPTDMKRYQQTTRRGRPKRNVADSNRAERE